MDHAEELLRRIRRERIRPVPRAVVVLRRIARICLLFAVLALLALSFALLFQEMRASAGHGWIFRELLSRAAPWIWGTTSILFGLLAWVVFRELPKAWRLRPVHVVLAFLAVGAVGGVAIESTNALLGLHRIVAHAVPAYRSIWRQKALRVWHSPGEGRLGGRLLGGTAFVDVEGRRWTLEPGDSSTSLPIAPGLARLQGRIEGDSSFRVLKWMPAPGEGARSKNREMR